MDRLLSALFFAGRSPGRNYCGDLWCYLASIQAHVYGKSKSSATIKVGSKAGQVLNKLGGRLGGGFGCQTKVAYAFVFKAYAQKQRHTSTFMKKAQWKNFMHRLMKVRRMCHSHTPSPSPQGRVSCTLSPAEVDTRFLNVSDAQHIPPHAWHMPLDTMLPLQTSVHSETSIVFWWTREGASWSLGFSQLFLHNSHSSQARSAYSLVELHCPACSWMATVSFG